MVFFTFYWHAPWKLFRVISGHGGWVRCAAVEPGNEWFATGAADRVIKIWDLASGKLKLSLTGHISTVRGLVVSPRQPYLFSCGEDRQVKCWDLEYNKVRFMWLSQSRNKHFLKESLQLKISFQFVMFWLQNFCHIKCLTFGFGTILR